MPVAAKRTTPDDHPAATIGPAAQSGSVSHAIVPSTEAGIDRALLSRVAQGEEAAFRTLMERHLNPILMTARRLLRDEAEAEDVAQEAFLRLWNASSELEVPDHGLRAWLRRVASNLAIDCLRKSKRLDVMDDVPEQAEAPEQFQALHALETSARVEEALALLPERQRVAVGLFHFNELSQREVAELMQLSEDALESLLARGRRRLAQLLKDDWQELLVTEEHRP